MRVRPRWSARPRTGEYARRPIAIGAADGRQLVELTITAQEEHALVRAHQAGDPDAFAEITSAYRATLLAHAQRRLGDRDAAHDALQETLLRAYRAIDRFGGDQLLGAWLHRIVDNVCNDELARRRREVVLLQ